MSSVILSRPNGTSSEQNQKQNQKHAVNGEATSHFRDHLPDVDMPRFTSMRQQDSYTYASAFKEGGNSPWLHALYRFWLELLQEPFVGVTNDGVVRPGLFKIQDEGVPIDQIVDATNNLLSQLSHDQKQKTMHHIDDPQWRTWSNPEFLLSDKGIRLNEQPELIRSAVLTILQLTLSAEGYGKAISAMRINHFLGGLVQCTTVMNEHSYNFVLFGTSSAATPWGISFYGHHLCLNIFFYATHLIISPWFTGAEPNHIDSGPHAGTRIMHEEERLGLQLIQSLTPDQQKKAQTYELMLDPKMPKGRWNHDDQRHLCGAYRDNRVMPYEGVLVSEMSAANQSLVTDILFQYLLYLPSKARQMRLDHCKSFYDETCFSWTGGYSDADPYYFRIQSPVIIAEFDHHSGVFLTNQEPAKFHIHTLLRTPNTGDYGHALRPLVRRREQEFIWEGDASKRSVEM